MRFFGTEGYLENKIKKIKHVNAPGVTHFLIIIIPLSDLLLNLFVTWLKSISAKRLKHNLCSCMTQLTHRFRTSTEAWKAKNRVVHNNWPPSLTSPAVWGTTIHFLWWHVDSSIFKKRQNYYVCVCMHCTGDGVREQLFSLVSSTSDLWQENMFS